MTTDLLIPIHTAWTVEKKVEIYNSFPKSQ